MVKGNIFHDEDLASNATLGNLSKCSACFEGRSSCGFRDELGQV